MKQILILSALLFIGFTSIAQVTDSASISALLHGRWTDTVDAVNIYHMNFKDNTVTYIYETHEPGQKSEGPTAFSYQVTKNKCSSDSIPHPDTSFYLRTFIDSKTGWSHCYHIVSISNGTMILYEGDKKAIYRKKQ